MRRISYILLTVLSLSTPIYAFVFVVPNGTTEANTLNLTADGDSAIIEEGGAITTGSFIVALNGNNQTVLNQGSLLTILVVGAGINNNGGNNNVITNSGQILSAGFFTDAIFSINGDNVVITNSGRISTTEEGANGIFNNNSENIVITNSGLISTIGMGSSGIVNSDGSANGVITNSGLILSTGPDGRGITNLGDDVLIINSGTIRSLQGPALSVGGINPTVSLLRGSNLQGFVQATADDLDLNVETGLNLALTLGLGSYGNLGIKAPFALVDPTIAVIDPTGLALQADVVADLSDTILDGIYRHRTVFPCSCIPCGCGVWVQGIGSSRKRGRDKERVGYDNWQGGFLIGYDAPLCGGNTGLFGGVSFGEAEVDEQTQRADTTSYVGGLTYERLFCNTFLGLAIAAGYVHWDNERFVMNNLAEGGVETAKADTGGAFVSPEVTVAQHFPWLCCTTMSFTLRYAGLFLGDYSEKGSLTNLSVKDREIDLLTTRFELALPYSYSRGTCCWSVEPYVGVFERYQVGGNRVDAVLLGQSLYFDPGSPHNLAAFLFGFRGIQSLGCFNLFLNLEGSFDNHSSSRILGEGGIGFRF